MLEQLRRSFQQGATGLLTSLYPVTVPAETLSTDQLGHFNRMLAALLARLKLEGINHELLDLRYDGQDQPLPFPDLHWEIATCWMLVDGTLPQPILLNDGSSIDYSQTLLKDPTTTQRWRRKLEYARTGFRYR